MPRLTRVRIELSAAGLIVANEGAPFTRDGVASLKLANFSPKRTRKRQMVGNKGLGFRAVLNWTRTPLVLSEGLALAFSAAAAHDRQQRLARTSEKLRTLIAEEQKTSGVLIVPLLTFSGFRENGEVGHFFVVPDGATLPVPILGEDTAEGGHPLGSHQGDGSQDWKKSRDPRAD